MAQKNAGRGLAFIYAQALFEAAFEAEVVEQIEEQLLALRGALDKDPQALMFLETPTLPFEDKQKVLEEALKNCHRLLVNFMCLMARNQRVGVFGQMVDIFHELANAKAGIAEFEVFSAAQLLPDELERLKAVLHKQTGRTAVLRETVAPGLLGGLLLKHGDKRWDTTLAHSLVRLVEQMETGRAS
jgi:F-type H+-transporting ATPase subunit delta